MSDVGGKRQRLVTQSFVYRAKQKRTSDVVEKTNAPQDIGHRTSFLMSYVLCPMSDVGGKRQRLVTQSFVYRAKQKRTSDVVEKTNAPQDIGHRTSDIGHERENLSHD